MQDADKPADRDVSVPTPAEARFARLKAALRDNLRKRKAQARARQSAGDGFRADYGHGGERGDQAAMTNRS